MFECLIYLCHIKKFLSLDLILTISIEKICGYTKTENDWLLTVGRIHGSR